MFEVILEAAPVQTVAVMVLSSRRRTFNVTCSNRRTFNVKDLLPL